LRAAVDLLKGDEREALLLRYDVDLSYELIADLLGGSPPGIKQRVFRARKRLRALLSEAES
jgi:DNA-directed RNA polymerase specialized sigma24 family protein